MGRKKKSKRKGGKRDWKKKGSGPQRFRRSRHVSVNKEIEKQKTPTIRLRKEKNGKNKP